MQPSANLNQWFGKLSEKDKIETLMQMVPYIIARQSSESLSPDELNELYSRLEEAMKQKHAQAV